MSATYYIIDKTNNTIYNIDSKTNAKEYLPAVICNLRHHDLFLINDYEDDFDETYNLYRYEKCYEVVDLDYSNRIVGEIEVNEFICMSMAEFFWLYKNCKMQFMKGEVIEGFINYKYDKYYQKYTAGNLYS